MARVGFLGMGEIAAALVQGLAGAGGAEGGHEIVVSPRNPTIAARLANEVAGVRIAADNEAVVAESDVVILCLLASVARQVLPGLPFRATQSVISAMVDLPLAELIGLCSPASDIAITIPLPFVASGGCPLPVFPASAALAQLYGAKNPVFVVHSEAALNAHFAATALCSPLLAQMQATADWLSRVTGDAKSSEAYVCGVIRGYLPPMTTAGHLAAMLAALSTEGGLNATLAARMAPAVADLTKGLDGFRPRLGLSKAP